ncbi:hypothetical protein MPSEU_000513300 [Mayamaea pseudoterrestris]|nr:hypothetical protein MPSEU_000513300 [Mayamaea pseudoterrestris]
MQVAQYGTDVTGHNFTKKLSKKQRVVKNRQRRTLEEQIDTAVVQPKQLRCSRRQTDEVAGESPENEQTHSVDAWVDNDSLPESEGDTDDEPIEEEGDVNEEEADPEENQRTIAERRNVHVKAAHNATFNNNNKQSRGKKMAFKMRNFKSIKLAEQHGEALNAHTRGRHKEAIQTLKQIAREAPSAPQVYSSLGMVYCDMLDEAGKQQNGSTSDDNRPGLGEDLWTEQLELAKKAYGAYHVAAILCKKDYTLWVRAADLACEVADRHSLMTAATVETVLLRDHHKVERQRWLNEAKNDYQTANNLRPAGKEEIAAKLAMILIELGHLSEALTLLTDMKERQTGQATTLFESSYKAWWLYAGLMVRIGRECDQWNRGDDSNKNIVLRRWLRKHSKTFKWKERRLQALIKALEAAVGSVHCKGLIDWLHSEAMVPAVHAHGNTVWTNNRSDDLVDRDGLLQREKLLREEKCTRDSSAFDETTEDLSLEPGQKPLLIRQSDCETLVLEQNLALDGFLIECHQNDTAAGTKLVIQDEVASPSQRFPISASFKTAISIASELLHLALGMGKYHCGILVGTSMSLYMKERSKMLVRRRQRMKVYEMQFTLGSVAAEVKEYSSDSVDSLFDLSDDDDLVSKPDVLAHMEKGVLPPELSVLHGCCLAGHGESDFLAFKYIESLKYLPQDNLSCPKDIRTSRDSWSGLLVSERGLIDQTEGYALVADVLQRAGKTKDFSVWLAPMFCSHVRLLTETGILHTTLSKHSDEPARIDKRNRIIKVVSASSALLLNSAQVLTGTAKRDEAGKMIATALARLSQLIVGLWTVQLGDKSISSELVELMQKVEFAARLSVQIPHDTDTLNLIFKHVETIVAIVCRVSSFDLSTTFTEDVPTLSKSLISSSWLSDAGKQLALRMYNICVANNVSFFSGWEDQPFNLALIRRKVGLNHFGITITDGLVFGKVSGEVEDELILQWDLIKEWFPDLASNFRDQVLQLRGNIAYTRGRLAHEKAIREKVVAEFGETETLHLLLHFSRMCLLRARHMVVPLQKGFILTSLSIVLPLSQFCVNKQLWDADIGKLDEPLNAMSKSLKLDALFLSHDGAEGSVPSVLNGKQSGHVRRSKRTLSSEQSGCIAKVFGDDGLLTVSCFIVIPCSRLLDEWYGGLEKAKSHDSNLDSKMAKLNSCLYTLRHSSTETAIGTASLNAAVALLDLASGAQNPFLCVEQAARFATKAPKRGVSDLAFQARLPEERTCSPLEALIILGRADCLQAVFFFKESAFLCKFVASLCKIHRKSELNTMLARQWKMVGMKIYNVYMAVRYAAAKVVYPEEKLPDFKLLHEEMLIYRKHALALQYSGHEDVLDTDEEQACGDEADTIDRGGRFSNTETSCLVEV